MSGRLGQFRGGRDGENDPVRDPWADNPGRAARRFRSARHLFISSLKRAGVTPKMAKTLARHSDIRLTLGVYTHVELDDQTGASL